MKKIRVKTEINDGIILLVGILVIGLLAPLVMNGMHYELGSNQQIINTIVSFFITTVMWLGCRQIVNFLWKKYPWHLYPFKHLIIEVFAIAIYNTIVIVLTHVAWGSLIAAPEPFNGILWNCLISMAISFFITSIYEGIYFYNQMKYFFLKSERLEKSNLEAKYETLKNQINPHFLFNALNTLMSYIESNPTASAYLQSLSDFFRYSLTNREKDVVLLREEIDIVKKYAFLQQSRFGDNLKFEINVPEKYFHYSIAPLALQMLVENAIKHNIIAKDMPLHINIFVDKSDNLVVENNLQRKMQPSNTSTQLGIKNIIDRYKFLTHKTLQIHENAQKFKVALPLVIVHTKF